MRGVEVGYTVHRRHVGRRRGTRRRRQAKSPVRRSPPIVPTSRSRWRPADSVIGLSVDQPTSRVQRVSSGYCPQAARRSQIEGRHSHDPKAASASACCVGGLPVPRGTPGRAPPTVHRRRRRHFRTDRPDFGPRNVQPRNGPAQKRRAPTSSPGMLQSGAARSDSGSAVAGSSTGEGERGLPANTRATQRGRPTGQMHQGGQTGLYRYPRRKVTYRYR